MRYTVINLNPCIDRVLSLSAPLLEGGLNRVTKSRCYPAGKGVNVARVLRRLTAPEDEVDLYAFLGEADSPLFSEVTENEGIHLCRLPTEQPTRSCYKLMTPNGTMTELNESGGPYGEAELKALAEAAASIMENGSGQVVFLCGSIPQGVEKGVYNWLIILFKTCGIKVILDCDGEALHMGVDASPFLIKPNFFELSGLAGKHFSTTSEAVDFARRLSVEKSMAILCTNGEKGSFLAKDGEVWQVSCPQVNALCPVGAGDCYLAGFSASLFKNAENSRAFIELAWTTALKAGASAAAAKVESEGSEIPKRQVMLARRELITVERISI